MFDRRYVPSVWKPGRTKVPPGVAVYVTGACSSGPESSAFTTRPLTRGSAGVIEPQTPP